MASMTRIQLAANRRNARKSTGPNRWQRRRLGKNFPALLTVEISAKA